jgi:hypothetical protein
MTWDEVENRICTPEEVAERKRMSKSYVRVIYKPKGRERNAFKAMSKMIKARVLKECGNDVKSNIIQR